MATTEPAWLDQQERDVWLGLNRVIVKLPSLLDAQLERDVGLTFFEYTVLAMLSEQPSRVLRMSHLATATNSSLSRLSHVARRLEAKEFMRREVDSDDGRCTNAILTSQGFEAVDRGSRLHVGVVRSLVFDPLTNSDTADLRRIITRLLTRIDPDDLIYSGAR